MLLLLFESSFFDSNNPIWSCDTGALFLLTTNQNQQKNNNNCLRIEVYDKINKKDSELIGEVQLEGANVFNGKWSDEQRRTFTLTKDRMEVPQEESRPSFFKKEFVESLASVVTAGLTFFDDTSNTVLLDDEFDEEDSLYGRSDTYTDFVAEKTEVDDDFVYGKTGTLALRFRVASDDDINFLKAVEIFDHGYKIAQQNSKRQTLSGVKKILGGRILAPLVTENRSSLFRMCSYKEFHYFMDHFVNGRIIDHMGVHRIRVKPGPNPKAPKETEFLTKNEMAQFNYAPSKKWVEAGSGTLGRVYVEILSCEGLRRKNLGKVMRKKTNPFICIICEFCCIQVGQFRNSV